MQEHAMSISTIRKSVCLGIGLALVLSAGTANAQTRQEEPGAMDVARTPLEDFNVDSKDIPEVLLVAAEDPYDDTGILNCNHIVAQIAVLDSALGPDFDIPQEEAEGISSGRVAKSVVGSFIPFRGLVREVSGANKARNKARLAFTAGMVRRGYLKGMGEARGCDYPARPRLKVGDTDTRIQSNVPPNIPRGEPEE
jgi:hypothetical protein